MSLYDFTAVTIDGRPKKLSDYQGKTVLVVNVASECGYTKQYAGLEELYRKHKDDSFVVLGFPCNQFGGQEPGTAKEIQEFCTANYGVTFPLFAKVDVNGDNEHPLFTWLKSQKKGIFGTAAIKWNFSKFLIDANGEVIKRYGSGDTPEAIEKDLP